MFSETAEESMIFTPDLCPVAPDLTGRTVLDDLYNGLLKVKGQVVEGHLTQQKSLIANHHSTIRHILGYQQC